MYEANDQIVCVHLPNGVVVDCIINSPSQGGGPKSLKKKHKHHSDSEVSMHMLLLVTYEHFEIPVQIKILSI